ncbi:D-alanyl-D-alanine carboxypeptidase/D-alanyl-D-alanine-endopeptidase [bacterium]|nr:D-alanyl-D-alanine carboxypeptidase/D-alanyl-D-alanine-endopeptidase [bacterium]
MNKMKNLFFVFLALFYSIAYAEENPVFDFSPVSEENISLVLYDTETHKNVLSINADKPFLYASNLKLLTSAVALKHLGGGFKFLTLFSFDKESGTLYIKAGGDPEMVIEKLWVVASDLKRLGIKGIKKVAVDDFLYGKKSALTAESGDKGDNGYLAFISPLSLNYNAVAIFVKAREATQPVEITLSAPSSYFSIKNTATGTSDGNNQLVVGAQKAGNQTEIVVKGSLGAARTKHEAVFKRVADPTRYYIVTLLNLMGENEETPIERAQLEDSFFTAKERINFTYKSNPLRDIIRTMNLYSSNFIADSLQFYLGATLRGDTKQGVEILKEFSQKELNETIDIVNGSGLGNDKNYLTGNFYIKLLQNVFSDYYGSIDFFSSLPVMGEDGTLKRANTSSENSGFIRGKTGSLTGVAALSGVMKAKSGKLYLFAFAINGFPSKSFKPMWALRDRVMNEIWEKY